MNKTEYFCIYTINEDSGKLKEIFKKRADFKEKETEINKARLSYDNKKVLTGGADGVLRLFTLEFGIEADDIIEAEM